MKIFKSLFYVLFTVVIVTIAGTLIYINLFARDLIRTKLADAVGHPIALSSVSYHFPFGLRLIKLTVGDFVRADRIYLQVDPLTIFDDIIKLTQFDLINPVLVLEDRELSWMGESDGDNREDAQPAGPRRLYDIGRVNVLNGRINVMQRQGQPPLKVELTNVRGHFKSVAVPWRARRMPFYFQATAGMNIFRSELTQRPAIGKGWVDPRRQILESELHLQDTSGTDQMNMTLQIADNNLLVEGNIHTDLGAAPEARTEGEVWDQIARPVVKQLTDGQGVLFDTQFSVRDSLDKFRLDTMVIEFKGAAYQPDPDEKKVLPAE